MRLLRATRRAAARARERRPGAISVTSAATSMTAATGTSQNAMKAKIAIGGQRRDRDLRHVLAEKRLQLLDAVDHRQHHAAGALAGEPGRPQRGDLVVEPAAQRLLHPGRGAVRDHRARWSSKARSSTAASGPPAAPPDRPSPRREHRASNRPRNTKRAMPNPSASRPSSDCQRDAAAQPACHAPQAAVEMHSRLPRYRSHPWALSPALRKREIFNRC